MGHRQFHTDEESKGGNFGNKRRATEKRSPIGPYFQLRWYLRNKIYRWILWNFPWMFSTKHCFEKYNKNDRSPFSFKKMWWANLTSFVPLLVLITRVIDRSKLHFAVGKNLTGRKCRAYRTISYKICGNITLFGRRGRKAFVESLFLRS